MFLTIGKSDHGALFTKGYMIKAIRLIRFPAYVSSSGSSWCCLWSYCQGYRSSSSLPLLLLQVVMLSLVLLLVLLILLIQQVIQVVLLLQQVLQVVLLLA